MQREHWRDLTDEALKVAGRGRLAPARACARHMRQRIGGGCVHTSHRSARRAAPGSRSRRGQGHRRAAPCRGRRRRRRRRRIATAALQRIARGAGGARVQRRRRRRRRRVRGHPRASASAATPTADPVHLHVRMAHGLRWQAVRMMMVVVVVVLEVVVVYVPYALPCHARPAVADARAPGMPPSLGCRRCRRRWKQARHATAANSQVAKVWRLWRRRMRRGSCGGGVNAEAPRREAPARCAAPGRLGQRLRYERRPKRPGLLRLLRLPVCHCCLAAAVVFVQLRAC
eukprot:364796-Chlamydomonas_euryale.AAC.14